MYSLTARAIELRYNINFSRQAVRQRAEKFADELSTISEETIDIAETNINKFLQDNTNPNLQYKMTVYVMNNRGTARGYGKHARPNDPDKPEEVFDIDGKIIRF